MTTRRASPYAMYVWRDGWDRDEGGTLQDFLDWSSSKYFTHTWNTPVKRRWLWDTCNAKGRQVDTIFLYGIDTSLPTRDCDDAGVIYVRETLREGREMVPGLKVFALLSEGDKDVSERHLVADVVWYNERCARDASESLDGVAVNNEAFDRDWSEDKMADFLDRLYKVRTAANSQKPEGSLSTHFSVGWVWGRDDNNQDIRVTWRGTRKPMMQHFIDIFDSVDVQVACVTSDEMERRMRIAQWDYGRCKGKKLWTTVYINKASPCQTTFFPCPTNDTSCVAWSHAYKSQDVMFKELDALEKRLPGAATVLHHFRGAYASGGHLGWPKNPV